VLRRRRRRRAGFTLVEVLAALGLVGAVGVMASASGYSLARLSRAALAEAAGLLAAERKVEELLASPEGRENGTDDVEHSGVGVRRVWRVIDDVPAPGLTRVEVSASWEEPGLTMLTLVAVAP
jgi:prepilin-type N-terminal cleavage/methylation domain-containing protein